MLGAVFLGGATIPGSATSAQGTAANAPQGPPPAVDGGVVSRASGVILRVTAQGERPLARQWVILHGIGSAGGRAIDSIRTVANGSFRLDYARDADSTTQYFVSTVYHGIAYVSGILPEDATPDQATLTVFDTTSTPIDLAVRGRHVLIFAPTDNPRRRVAEIYELSNDSTVTRIAREGGPPIWSAGVPTGAEEFASGPELLSNEALTLANGRVTALAPVAPGLKRIAYTYALPASAFPLSIPVEHATDVFEVLIEDREGEVIGPGLEETAPSNIEGRMFRRFVAQGMAPPSVVTVRVPAAPSPPPETNKPLVAVLGIVMIGALAIALRRARARPATIPGHVSVPTASETDALAREIAELDAEFERTGPGDAETQARYQAQRDQLKHRLAERLAAPRRA